MDTYNENLFSCLLFRNKQLTKELKRFEDLSALSVSSSQMLALSQLLKLHLAPTYGTIRNEYEWQNLFAVIDLLYGADWLPEDLKTSRFSMQELKLCYLVRAQLTNKAIALIFNITSCSVLKAKQRIKAKLSLSSEDSFDRYIQKSKY